MKNTIIYGLISVLIVGSTAYAAFSKDEIATRIAASKEYQQDLKEANDSLRKELAPKIKSRDELQARIDKINQQLATNSKQYDLEQAIQDALTEADRAFPNGVPSLR